MSPNKSNLNELMDSYSTISEHYLRTKRKPWKDFRDYFFKIAHFLSLSEKSIICDIGGGNGRNLLLFKDHKHELLLCDLSVELLRNSVLLSSPNDYLVNLEMSSLPFKRESFDLALVIASLHHLNNDQAVRNTLAEIKRILTPDGFCILSVWYKWKKDTKFKMIRDLLLYPLKKLFNLRWRFGDFYLPWKDSSGRIITKRYYHLYSRRELVLHLKSSGFKIIDLTLSGGKNEKDNIFALVKKAT